MESFYSLSEFLDDSLTPLTKSLKSVPSRGKKAASSKPTKARPSISASASRTSRSAQATADADSSKLAVSESASTLKASRGIDDAIDPMTLPAYVSVIERKRANMILKTQYFKVKGELSKYV